MPRIVWDKLSQRNFENGLDRGVLYLPDGSAVPWNGLTSVVEKTTAENSPVYFDGMKISDFVTIGDYEATLSAITYPDEFPEYDGSKKLRKGVYVPNQAPNIFSMSYRTLIGNESFDENSDYKIHILYNLIAIPSDKTYKSISNNPELINFNWTLKGVSEEFSGFTPTSSFTIDSRSLDPWLLEDLEEMLYGSESTTAKLPSLQELFEFLSTWYRIQIIDNEDGTWTATTDREGFIFFDSQDPSLFSIVNARVVYIDDDTYEISDAFDVSDTPLIKVEDNGDGTWTATTEYNNLIIVDEEDESFVIRNATIVNSGPDTYILSDTIE